MNCMKCDLYYRWRLQSHAFHNNFFLSRCCDSTNQWDVSCVNVKRGKNLSLSLMFIVSDFKEISVFFRRVLRNGILLLTWMRTRNSHSSLRNFVKIIMIAWPALTCNAMDCFNIQRTCILFPYHSWNLIYVEHVRFLLFYRIETMLYAAKSIPLCINEVKCRFFNCSYRPKDLAEFETNVIMIKHQS